MSSLAQSNRYIRLSLIGPCATAKLAAPTLARHLGISVDDATVRLCQAPATLADRMEANRARRLAALLLSLGVAVRMTPSPAHAKAKPCPDAKPLDAVYEVSVQPIEAEEIERLSHAISQALPPMVLSGGDRRPEALEIALSGPGGLVLTGLEPEQIKKLRHAFRKIDGLRIAGSSAVGAMYDILRDPRIEGPDPDTLAASLRRLGLVPCKLTGAVAARLDAKTRDHVLRRFGGLGLIALNHDFQRFDLFLTGAHNLSPRELADFLVVRSDLPRRILERMPRALRIESGLTRANALAFQSDYAALGLETCARLRVYHPKRPESAKRAMP